MRLPALVTTAVLVLALPLGIGGAADAKPKPKKKADLVVSTLAQTSSTAGVDVSVTMKNKGKKKAKASTVRVTLSTDAIASADDRALGSFPVGKVKPKKSTTVSGRLVVPSTVPAGSYTVIACADSGSMVKEKKETNNCRAAAGVVTVAAPVTPQPTTTTVEYSTSGATGLGGQPSPGVTGSATNDGTCTAGSVTTGVCTVPLSGSTVTLTAVPAGIGFTFTAWQSLSAAKPCNGTISGNVITFTNPASAKGCVAVYEGISPL